MKGLRARIDYLIKHNRFIQIAYVNVISFVMRAIGLFIRTDKKLMLLSAHGRGFNDSPRALYEAMRRDSRFKDFKYVWAVENPKNTSIEGASLIAPDTPGYFLTSLKAGYWVTCVNIERGLRYKKRNTVYLNTWHGIPLKTIGNAANGRKDYDFSNIDYFCCSGDYDRAIYERDFGVRREALLESGLPRNDELYKAGADGKKAMRDKLGIPDDKKVILYAPTWRDSVDGGASYSVKPPVDIKLWRERLSDNYVLLVRAHAYTDKLDGMSMDGFVWNVSDYPSVNELMIASDILITDYSSIAFDYSILERPIICFAYDYDEYKKSRGLYVDLEQAMPGGVVRDQNGVLDRLENMNYAEEVANTVEMKKQYIQFGSRAIDMCLDALSGDK